MENNSAYVFYISWSALRIGYTNWEIAGVVINDRWNLCDTLSVCSKRDPMGIMFGGGSSWRNFSDGK